MSIGLLICPACSSDELTRSDQNITCRTCNELYPVFNDVPLLLPPKLVVDYRRSLATRLELPSAAALTDVFTSSAMFGYQRLGLGEEFANLKGRFPELFKPPQSDAAEKEIVVVSPLLAAKLLPGETTTRSIRIRNADRLLQSVGEYPHYLSYHLFKGEKLICFEGERSAFPVPLRPFAEMTVPLTIKAPTVPGTYRLDLHMLEEKVTWGSSIANFELTVGDLNRHTYFNGLSGDFDYATDFNTSIAVLNEALDQHQGARLLELGGGMYPLSAHASGPLSNHYVVDLCYPELQLSRLHHAGRSIQFVCGDVDTLPLKPAAFDVIVICAALHHFPDPIATLKRIKPLLSERGTVVLVREPCFVDIRATGYLADLLAGFNEQVFVPEEYTDMFHSAGYEIVSGRIDYGGSLKVIIAPTTKGAITEFSRSANTTNQPRASVPQQRSRNNLRRFVDFFSLRR